MPASWSVTDMISNERADKWYFVLIKSIIWLFLYQFISNWSSGARLELTIQSNLTKLSFNLATVFTGLTTNSKSVFGSSSCWSKSRL